MIRSIAFSVAVIFAMAAGSTGAKADAGKLYYPGDGGTELSVR